MQTNENALTAALVVALRNLKPFAAWAAALLALLYLTSGIQTIQPNESALRLRFGKLSPHVYQPGIIFALPEPFESIVRIQTGSEQTILLDAWASRGKKIGDPDEIYQPTDEEVAAFMAENGGIAPPVRTVEIADATTLDPVIDGYAITSDKNIIQARFALRYRITDPIRYYKLAEPQGKLVSAILYQAATETIARHSIEHSLTTERQAIAQQISTRAADLAQRYQAGITIAACELRELSPPRQTVAAFEDVVNAQNFSRTLLENAKAHKTNSLARAEGRARTIRLKADTFTHDLISQAQGESSAFLSFANEYKKHPELVANRIYLETIDSVMQASNSAALFSASQAKPTLFIEPAPER